MKIVNKTTWRTDHIATIIRRVAKEEMVSLKRAHFLIKTRRQSCRWNPESVTGCAYCSMPPCITLKMPEGTINKVQMAQTIAHEFGHSQGLRGHTGAMSQIGRYGWRSNWRENFAWASEMPLEKKEQPAKTVLTRDAVIQRKLAHALEMAEQWHSKVKASQTWFKKWSRKVSYYDKQLTKAALPPVESNRSVIEYETTAIELDKQQ